MKNSNSNKSKKNPAMELNYRDIARRDVKCEKALGSGGRTKF